MSAELASGQFTALGTTVVFCTTDRLSFGATREIVAGHIRALDAAASRFRPDSELVKLNSAQGAPVEVSDLLFDAIGDALRAAATTDGLVSPTVGEAMVRIGYDRDFSEMAVRSGPLQIRIAPVPGWTAIKLEAGRNTVTLPVGVALDLGATAKAACADRTAHAAADATGSGVLVNLGGDVAVAGAPPAKGWAIRIADCHDAPPAVVGPIVAVRGGGLATSGTSARRWQRGGKLLHHVVDPSTGRPAGSCWRTVSVAASTCLEANTASTAAIILGPCAPAWLARRGLHARLVNNDGMLVRVGQWPADELSNADASLEKAS